MTKILFAGTVFSSAFLLFLVQPIVSKNILPWFGGSAGVWAVCMAFFQIVLLLGYAYSHWLTRYIEPRRQVVIHICLLGISLLTLPVMADASWKPDGKIDPGLWILFLLTSTVGLPYFLLSTTGPLVQAWVSRTIDDARVYRLFSLSNLASLLALLSYPFLIEPYFRLTDQSEAWSTGYLLFVALCTTSGIYFSRHARQPPVQDLTIENGIGIDRPTFTQCMVWLSLSAMGSWLLVAVTNHITQNVAAIPFLWILPLTLYLLSFVLCFESDKWYRRQRFMLPTALLLALCAYGLQDSDLGSTIKVAVPLYSAGLFVICMFLHGELASLKPSPRHLTRFYLMISLGGAMGGILVGLVAPRVLPAYYELGLGFVIVCLLAMYLFKARRLLVLVSGGLALLCAAFVVIQVLDDVHDARRLERNFYGTLLTVDVHRQDERDSVRQLYHGSIKHGEQYLSPDRAKEPSTYYGPTSGIGLVLLYGPNNEKKKVGLIGLGAGTLAAYGKTGDNYRFYEINPQVIDLARSEFSFMRDSQATVETVLGDARLALEKEASNDFDVLAVDAFSGDSIPVHLITREAMTIYRRHIKQNGIIAFHITNRYLSLAPVIEKLASDQGLYASLVHDDAGDSSLNRTDWVLVAKHPERLNLPEIAAVAETIPRRNGVKVWTDDFNNLFQVLK